jgi:hypothetical protein
MSRIDNLYLQLQDGFAVIYNDDPFFLNKHGNLFRRATDAEAKRSHAGNSCKLTASHYHYGKAKCMFCGKTLLAYGVKQ